MTQTFEFKQSGHLHPALLDPATSSLNADKLAGREEVTGTARKQKRAAAEARRRAAQAQATATTPP